MDPRAAFPPSTLAVVAVPLGNPGDITLRALQVLAAADLVAAEDTRTARRLLAEQGISKPLVSYHDWNEAQRAEALLGRIQAGGRVALISEAGTPSISDPGYDVVRLARKHGLRVMPVPGPSAISAFLSASGLPTNAFSFFGFPPNRAGPRKRLFRRLAERPETLLFYESPRRIVAALADAQEVFGERLCSLGREMTKPHEEFLFGTLSAVREALVERPRVLGEVCWGVVGAGDGQSLQANGEEAASAARALLARDLPLRSAAKELAVQFRISAKEAYAILLAARRDRNPPPGSTRGGQPGSAREEPSR